MKLRRSYIAEAEFGSEVERTAAEALLDIADRLDAARSMIVVQRDRLISDGFNETIAEHMALELWRCVVRSIFR